MRQVSMVAAQKRARLTFCFGVLYGQAGWTDVNAAADHFKSVSKHPAVRRLWRKVQESEWSEAVTLELVKEVITRAKLYNKEA